ncbi:MAG: peptide ABC transporter substrate-binding protein [Egibacteraceae bacterium]
MKGRHNKLAVLLVGCALIAGACTGGSGGQARSGEFSAEICEPRALTPGNGNDVCSAEVLGAVFSPLIDFDTENAEDPVLMGDEAPRAHARSVTSDDQRTWTITLKEGWTFHDGTPVTAQSYVDAWNYSAYGPNAQNNASFFTNIAGYADLQCGTSAEAQADCVGSPPASQQMSGLRAIDAAALEVTLSAPFSQFPLTIGYTAFYPLPRAFFDDPDAFNEAPIGDGPFMVEGSWSHNQGIRVVRYPGYAGRPAVADAVNFQIYEDLETAFTDLQAGNLDIMDRTPRSQVATAPQRLGDRFREFPGSAWTYLGFPTYDPRFANPDLRRAISMAIDRGALTDTVRPDSVPADSFVSPVVAGYRPGACGQWCEFNPERARELLARAGGWDGELILWFNSDGDHATWMEGLANQLRANLGIQNIRFQTLLFPELLNLERDRGITGPFRSGWVMDYPSPQSYLQPVFGTGGSSNYTYYSNPEFDEALAQGNAAGTITDGLAFYQRAEDLLIRDMPGIPLFFDVYPAAWSERIDNVSVDPFERMNLADIVVVG